MVEVSNKCNELAVKEAEEDQNSDSDLTEFHAADNMGLIDRTMTNTPSETPAMGPDDNILPNEDATSADLPPTRSGRKRKAKDLQAISDCLCGEAVTEDEISQATCVIQCKKPGCETLWVSRIPF